MNPFETIAFGRLPFGSYRSCIPLKPLQKQSSRLKLVEKHAFRPFPSASDDASMGIQEHLKHVEGQAFRPLPYASYDASIA